MAIDGSFCLDSGLERFFDRCPELGTVSMFNPMSKKEHVVTEEEVVDCMAKLFLNPNYTIPLLGCFRPISGKIVDRTVAILQLVMHLGSNPDNMMVEFKRDKLIRETKELEDLNGADVIEVYARSGRVLDLHELACLAFCRALDLAPFLLGSVLSYFEFAPPPFQRILVNKPIFQQARKDSFHLLNGVRTSYRLLLLEPEVFSKLWDWSCFLDLVQELISIGPNDDTESMKKCISDIKWCGIQILSVILKMTDRAKAYCSGSEDAVTSLLRWQEFCQDVSVEKAGYYLEASEQKQLDCKSGETDFNYENCLQSFGENFLSSSSLQVRESVPSIKRRRMEKWNISSNRDPFVLTSAVKKSYEMVVLAVSQKWPVLLYGPAGAGKTALINKLAHDSGNQVLSIHINEQIDGKTLIGAYVCTEKPGEFRWQPGSLTQAVLKGFWVVFEDIDKASSDVQSILLPLLEGATSFVTSHGEPIRVAESFRLFSTISSYRLNISRNLEGGKSLGVLWRRVMVKSPSNRDMQNILKALYPNLEALVERILETFDWVNSASFHNFSGFHVGDSTSVDRFSLRDLLKWCKRIAGLGLNFTGNFLSAYECNCIYQEAVDIFAAYSTSAENRLRIMRGIGDMWAVPASAIQNLYPPNKPIIKNFPSELRIGRAVLERTQTTLSNQKKPFVQIHSSLHLLERIACSVKCNEPVLLIGETGTGKTTLVQNLAMRLGQRLTVLNLSQQSDVADVLGGFKPMDAQFVCLPLYKEFEYLFSKICSTKVNEDFLAHLQKHLIDKNWKMLLNGFKKGLGFFRKLVAVQQSGPNRKRRKSLTEEVVKRWENFSEKLEAVRGQISLNSAMLFSFVEGAFITALKNGDWILLDEINLAPPETLQRIIGVLEGENGSLCLAERGDSNYINRHSNFRIFACMNPATDAGKRDLPCSLRSRFTEYFVDDVLDDEDLILFVSQFMDESNLNTELVSNIVRFYKAAKAESEVRLQDGANQKPQYSLRSLYRALEYTREAKRKFGFNKAFYDGFCMFFLTLLDKGSSGIMNKMIVSHLLEGNIPPHVPFDGYFTVKSNSAADEFVDNYVLTRSVKENLRNLARAILVKKYPVLLQGPTSSGKTSLVQYLAAITGNEFVRINNHEHTDLQEYLGSYISDPCGRLVFHEGVLVKAVRNGNWIVLDELNLAPSDVLEALNRLLDDNRELFVPELRETIPAHPNFMLYATQNPPTFYGGRKMLSRAFRNRFVEIHIDEIPENELSVILENRCKIPESYAKKMVEVMKELQLHRQSSKVFAGKHGFITPRDLFRWANRFRVFGNSYEDLTRDGYYLLAERLRDENEKTVVQEVMEKHLRVKLFKDDLYKQASAGGETAFQLTKGLGRQEDLGSIIWTESMRRLYFLVERCYKLREPVLLVGETGGGKTTVCQLLSTISGSKLHILNCHQYTETSDFLGGFYPVRERGKLALEFRLLVEQLILSKAYIDFPQDITISSDISQASSTLAQLDVIINSYRQGLVLHTDIAIEDVSSFENMKLHLIQLHQKWQTIFCWQDGPLVKAMKDGDLFLVDEISLADDSVLERLNSVLEPERKMSLAEKGGTIMEKITAHPNFFILATMNPGGDYGKKELSPALRNRLTEIWVPPVSAVTELRSIALERLSNPDILFLVDPMLNFWEWFNKLQTGRVLTVRDLLSWVGFINATEASLQPVYSFLHGAFLVLLDGLTLGTSISKREAGELRKRCLSFLIEHLKLINSSLVDLDHSNMDVYGWGGPGVGGPGVTEHSTFPSNMPRDNLFGISPFYIETGCDKCEIQGFEFLAPTTHRNAFRVLRAMQLAKPVLLEGSPGVGKTSLIVALGKYSGNNVVRINLSEQTDIMDLLGSDLPVESDEGMKFAWSDGILLQALKKGCWVLLDELNLAPQSVLEGLNAILDHRAEVFIPELGLTFKCPSSFRVFACQNPSYQGGGRKGLPKSFLNRFTKVYVDELVEDDYLFICGSLYPSIPKPLLMNLISFNKRLHKDTMLFHKFAQNGSPWEFNLRDVIRSCQIIQGAPEKSKFGSFLNIVYVQRMRTASDRKEVIRLYEQIFGMKPVINPFPRVQLNPINLIVGDTTIKRNLFQSSGILESQLKIFPGIRNSLEAAAQCVKHQWLCILIGPAASGKTSLIRLLAQLTGNILNELNLSSSTDTSELLGCFEQYNALRSFRSVIYQVESFIKEYCSLQLGSSMEAFINERKEVMIRWLAFLSRINSQSLLSSSTYIEKWMSETSDTFSLLSEIIEQLRLDLEENVLPVSWSFKDLDRIMNTVLKLQDDQQKRVFSAKFEWVTGLLIKAIEKGEWIVLENANLCNPTVLDRINSLVEPSGTITVNECGLVDGKPVMIRSHPNFRMFLTVNPMYGEVSRAMRNRGVEIFMMQPFWVDNDIGIGYSFEESELLDAKRFLVLSGIPIAKLVEAMAKAHIYAKCEALCLGVNITCLELSHWVQLFQQLLTKGNRPIWSLHISWEHTYFSSIGEAEGADIINHGKTSYLSADEFSKFDSIGYSSLCLPGGWPLPMKLRDFISYSKETTVRQNCMYLEYLGAQYASSKLRTKSGLVEQPFSVGSEHLRTYLVDVKMLYHIIFPRISDKRNICSDGQEGCDLSLGDKMLFLAANWTIEQATESDLEIYKAWFRWFDSKVQGHCSFFRTFLDLFIQELDHPIWEKIVKYRSELLSYHHVDLDLQPITILSSELVTFTASNNDVLDSSRKFLSNGINSVGILRLSFKQWNAEREYDYDENNLHFIPLLKSIQVLEKEVLNLLVESPCFDMLIQSYIDFLDDHILFWRCLTSTQFECLILFWRPLIKDAAKLQNICPRAFKTLVMESEKLDEVSSWRFHSQKSMLWLHGGHPFLPSSAEIYCKQNQILSLCKSVWPTNKLQMEVADDSLVGIVASTDTELRFLTMQGVCMSSHIMCKSNEDDTNIIEQLEQIYQMLLGRCQHEETKLREKVGTMDKSSPVYNLDTCCIFSPEIMCLKSGFHFRVETVPINDIVSFSLDMELLQELSKIVLLDDQDLQHALYGVSDHLRFALNFSLKVSSRTPTDFLPHQRMLWMLDAWTSMDAANVRIASLVMEMWFRWHSSLWGYCYFSFKNFSRIDAYDISLPDLLLQPVKTAIIDQILKSTSAIKDYTMQCLKLRVISRYLWQSPSSGTNLPSFVLSAARSLFQQIIYAHRKSFDADKYAKIKSILSSFQKNVITQDEIHLLSSLIASSSHQKLTSLINMLIMPLLQELYIHYSSKDFLQSLGCSWVRIGGLRFHLLLSGDELDPVMKYSCKYSQIVEKISLLELEIKVRQECNHLAGLCSVREADMQRVKLLENLELRRKRLQRKIVFRSDPRKFKKLRYECDEFLGLVSSLLDLISNVEGMDLQKITDQVRNWQETATCFINQLSDEYAEYIDVIQPVQVAVYEMKFGLSMVQSSAFQKEFLNKVGRDSIDSILETIYSFMRFPKGIEFKSISTKVDAVLPEFLSFDVDFPINIWVNELHLLEKLMIISKDANADKAAVLPTRASVHQNILVRVAHFVADTLVLNKSAFILLDKIFDDFASLWMDMKTQTKLKSGCDAQQYKFKPRAFKIENIYGIDISNLKNISVNESFSDWKESILEEFSEKEVSQEHGILEEEWNLIEESVLISMIDTHNKIFGSINLVQVPGKFQVLDTDRLLSFINAYDQGAGMIKELEGLFPFSLDAKLVPEHLLRLCQEMKQKFFSSHKSGSKYNFYKDSNAPFMSKMVMVLSTFKRRILSLLNEWEDNPDLQRILDVIEMLLAIPLNTPLAKAHSGLQFLLHRAWTLQENIAKLAITDDLEPLLALVSSWEKMEFESWPALLDEVQEQYEINAGKLWFPLYSVLQHRHSSDIAGYSKSTIKSLEEFIQTSNVGEFLKRLQLLVSFHGQISMGRCLGSYSSPCQMENLKILYNVFGFYVQFLPLILEHIRASRRSIEAELEELLKLRRWERSESCLTMGKSKSARQKLKKLLKKYTDVLQQPVMLILNEEAAREELRAESINFPKCLSGFPGQYIRILKIPFKPPKFTYKDFSEWFEHWNKKVEQNLHLQKNPGVWSEDATEVKRIVTQFIDSQSGHIYQEEWKKLWDTLEIICQTTGNCSDLWKDEKKRLGKRRALSDLLKLLENCGLSKRKSVVSEELKMDQTNFLQPSYNVQHLLLLDNKTVGSAPTHKESLPDESLHTEWKTANEYYFKSMASLQLLRQICLNFHKDFTFDQVERSCSFLEHLILIQQEQRAAAYEFEEHIRRLRKFVSLFKGLHSNSITCDDEVDGGFSLTPYQHASFKCMWRQKQLFDSLCVMFHEEYLVLKTVESTHLSSCESIKDEANRVTVVIEKFLPLFQKSKDKLDHYLLGSDKIVAMVAPSLPPLLISKKMEQLVLENFQTLREFEEHLRAFLYHDLDRRSVTEALFCKFDEIFKKGKETEEDFRSTLTNKLEESSCYDTSLSELQESFIRSLRMTYMHIMDAFKKLSASSCFNALSEESLGNITSWKVLVESYITNLGLGPLGSELVKTVSYMGELVNYSGNANPNISLHVGAELKHLISWLDLILKFSDDLLCEFLAMLKTVSLMTHILANTFASLYTKGFGVSTEEQLDENINETAKDASGTGMGEGEGCKDVSDQITDEDQLLGSIKQDEEQDAYDDVPSKNDKGIEMDQDFNADAFSVSEDSGDDNEEGSDDEEKLDSAMGETGAESEVIDEKLWNKDEEGDEIPNNTKEKYESGPSIRDKDISSRELRAKEEDHAKENGELSTDENDERNDENESQDDGVNDMENLEGMNIDKDEACASPAGLKPEEMNQASDEEEESMDLDELEKAENHMEENDESAENENGEEGKDNSSMDKTVEEAECEQTGKNNQMDDNNSNKDHEDNSETNLMGQKKNVSELGNQNHNLNSKHMPNSIGQQGEFQAADMRNLVSKVDCSDGSDAQNNIAPTRGLPSDSMMEIPMADSSEGGELCDGRPKPELTNHDPSLTVKNQPNPYRNVGDALENWKERVKVSVDIQENKSEGTEDDVMDNTAKEYGYTLECEKSTAQALGPATSNQIDRNINNLPDKDDVSPQNKELPDMLIEKQNSETCPFRSCTSILNNNIENQIQMMNLEENPSDLGFKEQHSNECGDCTSLSESLVSIKKSYMSEDMIQLSKLSVSDHEIGKAKDLEELNSDVKENASASWQKLELNTTRLSQELTEQLRLVLEPTLASKLQGDYKTGKRINMKKVIPYIASHYRRDKIWLRRTRPNKLDYQVVIAVDDSRSMSESCCGNVAIEALVTVCRAMSQLEVGSLAVASFGKKGNTRLLKEFDQPFTGEAGLKIISSLTFKQENTIADEPMVDLLKYLNNMLDAAVANARLPSGQNPLQQLVLIIADGRFHEKENLKRCVRDFLSKKRLVAFLLLDSPQESIMDLMEASFSGGDIRFSKYLDSFPFPYYIVLKNIEALPRTLADLLRQWFELMQYSRD